MNEREDSFARQGQPIISFLATKSIKRRLQVLARLQGVSLSEYVRAIVLKAIDEAAE